jgi:hypothetical protein
MRTPLLILLALSLILMSCSGEDGDAGPQGESGENGYHCWDTNTNRSNDPEEDTNDDGEWNNLDCIGMDGLNGKNGVNCWDLNADFMNDPEEDINEDGKWDVTDCQGADGNADVQKIILELDNPFIYFDLLIELEVPQLTPEVLQNYVLLFQFENVTPNGSAYLPLPGRLAIYDRSYGVIFEPGFVYIEVTNFDGSDTSPGWMGLWDFLHITLIKISALEDKGQTAQIQKALMEADIVIEDHKALSPYFNKE